MKNKKISENYLEKKPLRREDIRWTADESGLVTLDIENKGIINRITQILIKKPKVSHIHLDEMGSFIWPLIDGEKSISISEFRFRNTSAIRHFLSTKDLHSSSVSLKATDSSGGILPTRNLITPKKQQNKNDIPKNVCFRDVFSQKVHFIHLFFNILVELQIQICYNKDNIIKKCKFTVYWSNQKIFYFTRRTL